MGAELATEIVTAERLQPLLQEMQAIPYPDRSSSLRHVYFSRNQGLWVGVSRRGNGFEVSLFETCPCSGG
jgi:hypothetical protein